jgi:hypothetical protein
LSKINLQLTKKNQRSCDGCTKCCEGWLSADIYGEEMFPGKPCRFVEKNVGCSIYDDRPKDPCKNFMCFWRAEDTVPLEFKPSEIGSLITSQDVEGIEYYSLVECGVKLDSQMLSWFVTYCLSNQINALWTVDGEPYWMGDPRFNNAMDRRYQAV